MTTPLLASDMRSDLQPAPDAERPVRALVVDDEIVLAELLSLTLHMEGWEVRSAHNGRDALAELASFGPDVVVLDRMLPDLSGLQLLDRMRRLQPGIPVVFVTARDSVEDRCEGLDAGADDYIVKPYSLAELIRRLKTVLRRAQAE